MLNYLCNMKFTKSFSISEETLEKIKYICRKNYWKQSEVLAEAIQRLYAEEKDKEGKREIKDRWEQELEASKGRLIHDDEGETE